MTLKRALLAGVFIAAAPVAALADIVGTYVATEGKERQTMTLSYKDDRHIRMDIGAQAYMLVSGEKAYLVTRDGGETVVMDLDTMPKMAMPGQKPDAKEDKTSIRKTGKKETVAGITGEVYEILSGGERHEVVLSTDKRAQALNKAFMALGKRMAQGLGAGMSAQLDLAAREAQKHGYGGLLRADQSFVLQSLEEKSKPAGFYELPKGSKPVEMPPMPAFDPAMMQQMQQQMQQMMKQQQGR